VNIGSGGKTGDEESTKQAIALIREIAAMAADAGVKLAVKPHVGQAIHDSATGLRLMNEVSSPVMGLNFDPSHLYRANENPEEVAPKWGSRILTSHFRDCPHREGNPGLPEQQIPGRGVVNIPATLKALKAAGYAGPLNLEVIGAAKYDLSRAMGIAAESRGYLHRCLQEIGVE
jgi:sugar phosphate isomerase/epimerase